MESTCSARIRRKEPAQCPRPRCSRPAALGLVTFCIDARRDRRGADAAHASSPEDLAKFEAWWDAQPKVSLPFETGGAKLFIVEFTDLQCPFCRQKYIELKPILEKYADRGRT